MPTPAPFSTRARQTSSPPLMMATSSGPVEAFYRDYTPSPPPPTMHTQLHVDPALRAARAAFSPVTETSPDPNAAYSRSPSRGTLRSASGPALAGAKRSLSNAKSHPVLLPSRAAGSVKDMANRFNERAVSGAQPTLAVRTSDSRYHRDISKSKIPTSPSRTANGISRLQKRRPGQASSPQKSAASSFDTGSSFASTTTVLSTKSQPHAAFSPKKPKQMEQTTTKPLFGEITSDGQWTGNFDIDSYGPLPTFQPSMRRASDGTLALSHSRSQSQDMHPGFGSGSNPLSHKRSRSDVDAYRTMQAPTMPTLHGSQSIPTLIPSPSYAQTRTTLRKEPTANHSRAQSVGPAPPSPASRTQSRAASAMSNATGRNRLSKSPTRLQQSFPSSQNNKPATLASRRYSPPNLATPSKQMLAAKITALPKLSPPLRSSRPRQPVSAATTAASRARAAGARSSPTKQRPSEQWLGKPYDAQQERKRREIPELRQVDFAARRERIIKTMSERQSSVERESVRSVSASSHSRSQSRKASVEQSGLAVADEIPEIPAADEVHNPGAANVVDQHQMEEFNRELNGALGEDEGKMEAEKDKTKEDPRNELKGRLRGLSVDTSAKSLPVMHRDPEPMTAGTEHTEFEFDESPVLGRPEQQQPVVSQAQPASEEPQEPQLTAATYQPTTTIEQPALLTAATYRPSAADEPPLLSAATYNPPVKVVPPPVEPTEDPYVEEQRNPSRNSLLENVMLMRQRSAASSLSAEPFGSSASAASHSDIGDQWGFENDQGSIRIMLDDDPTLQPTKYAVTPDTPPDAAVVMGTAVVYSNDTSYDVTPEEQSEHQSFPTHDSMQPEAATILTDGTTEMNGLPEHVEEEDDFDAQIRKANEDWERRFNGGDAVLGAEDKFKPPTPPPKDSGYTPRSSIGPNSGQFNPSLMTEGLRLSTSSDINIDEIHAAGSAVASAAQSEVSSPVLAPPLPNHAPPPVPPLPLDRLEVQQMPAAYSERESSELSPRLRKHPWGPSPGSSRPSMDSQRPHIPVPASASMSSFGDSTRVGSLDVTADGLSKLSMTTSSPGPEQKRLQKRRHIVMELLNTENSYHQDLKIIEDIYKATVGDFVSPEDKKTLFGNCDEIERFSLRFFDELRKAIMPAYAAPKNMRWNGKRGSMSTTQSDATGQTAYSMESVDEEKDKGTTIGKCFIENLTTMETIYGAYLKNHDAANQRLSALQTDTTVKCWLDECHANASDITSAWDLDSLLVKPTQRVAKYPLMLGSLLEVTPIDHPDHEALKTAARGSIDMLGRINDAKKRADLVEQMIGRKGKEIDVRTGLAKAFGRKTEKIKERMGVSEAYQDVDFDALAHKFGGHYIRLQITMRDFQDYVNRTDKAVDQIGSFASSLELFADVSPSSLPEIASKWRRYGHAIRDLVNVALAEHKATISKRVIGPLIEVIKLHENPQTLIARRKKRIVDYAKVRSIEKKGEKPAKKEIEAAEMYEAINHQLKLELPKLYELTGNLVRSCQACFVDIMINWQDTWQRKLKPMIEECEIPDNVHDIAPAFLGDYELMRTKLAELGIINGSVMADSANFLSPTSTILGDSESGATHRPSTMSKRTMSMGSDGLPSLQTPSSSKRHSGAYTPDTAAMDLALLPNANRMRSNSSMSSRQTIAPTPSSFTSANRPWSNSNATAVSYSGTTPTSSFTSRPSTANQAMQQYAHYQPRPSTDNQHSPRPASGQTYFTARPDMSADSNSHRFSGIFTSALPPDTTELPAAATPNGDTTPSSARPMSRSAANTATQVLFVCASLFEFNIDKSRKEGGYPYLTYVQGEVFDVVGQKGELWLAKNQDDATNSLGWIWEQHFVILSQD